MYKIDCGKTHSSIVTPNRQYDPSIASKPTIAGAHSTYIAVLLICVKNVCQFPAL